MEIFRTKSHIPLNPYNENEDSSMNTSFKDSYDFAGKVFPAVEALRRALGNDVLEDGVIPDQIPDQFILPLKIPEWSIWNGDKYFAELKKRNQMTLQKKHGAFIASLYLFTKIHLKIFFRLIRRRLK